MNKYVASLRLKGQSVKTAVFADSQTHARLILQYQFGMDSIVSAPKQVIEATKPPLQAPVVAVPNANLAPRLTLLQQRALVQQRKLKALIQQRANSELQQQAKVTELDKILAMRAMSAFGK
jgi:hypothetical protein